VTSLTRNLPSPIMHRLLIWYCKKDFRKHSTTKTILGDILVHLQRQVANNMSHLVLKTKTNAHHIYMLGSVYSYMRWQYSNTLRCLQKTITYYRSKTKLHQSSREARVSIPSGSPLLGVQHPSINTVFRNHYLLETPSSSPNSWVG